MKLNQLRRSFIHSVHINEHANANMPKLTINNTRTIHSLVLQANQIVQNNKTSVTTQCLISIHCTLI